jgi:hypothetical protein
MRQVVRTAFPGFTDSFEANLMFPYTDVLGLVTTGRGDLIDFGKARRYDADPIVGTSSDYAESLPWTQFGAPADKSVVHDQFWLVKRAWPAVQSFACGKLTNIRLSPQAVDDLSFKKLDEMWSTLLSFFPGAEAWCADAQLGLISMSWALGEHFSPMFPHFTLAANTGDWDVVAGPPGDVNTVLTARGQCWMKDGSPGQLSANLNPGLRKRNIATKVLFTNAKLSKDPDTLYFPQAFTA